ARTFAGSPADPRSGGYRPGDFGPTGRNPAPGNPSAPRAERSSRPRFRALTSREGDGGSSTMTDVLASLLAKVTQELAEGPDFPVATYRLQFHAGFTFRDACRLVPYLHDLGISHCYASPYLQARPGSTHGYDITNHQLLNPEIGSEDDYADWVTTLHAHSMGQILDTVPNH